MALTMGCAYARRADAFDCEARVAIQRTIVRYTGQVSRHQSEIRGLIEKEGQSVTLESESDPLATLRSMVERDWFTLLDTLGKATQPSWQGLTPRDVALRSEPVSSLRTPLLTLDRAALSHNIAAMQTWAQGVGAAIAPHGKTTMLPALWLRQLEAGAWGITVANEPQLQVALAAGVPRIILASSLVRPEGIEWLAYALRSTPATELYCWVDSSEAVGILTESLSRMPPPSPLNVLIEIGEPGARTGTRSRDVAVAVARLVAEAPHARLVGVSGFEGVIASDSAESTLSRIDAFLNRVVEALGDISEMCEGEELILTAGGSSYFDRVVEVFSQAGSSERPIRVILRSGGYIVHDSGVFELTGPRTRAIGPEFRAALHLWSRVLSTPESELAVLDAGRRDVSFDAGLPTAQLVLGRGPSGVPLHLGDEYQVIGMNDQHLMLRMPPGSPLRTGDLVRFGISHPCTAFDKWRQLPVIDDASRFDPVVVDVLTSRF